MAYVFKRTRKAKCYSVKYRDHTGKQILVKAYSDRTESDNLARRLENEQRAIKLGDVDPQQTAKRIERAKPASEQIAEYKVSLQAAGRDKDHIAYTIKDCEKFVEHAGVANAGAITRPHMDRFVASLQLAKVDSNRTINRRIGSVQAWLGHLKEIGGVTDYVLLKYPKQPVGGTNAKRKSVALSAADAVKMVTHAGDRADLYSFCLKSGLRQGEIRLIPVSALDFEHKQIHVGSDISKSGKAEVIPMHDTLVSILQKRCEGKQADAPVFSVASKAAEIAAIRAACKRAGINQPKIGFHSLRHTFCTLLAKANIHPNVLMKLARHADLKTTLGYYVHFQRTDEATAINLL